MGVEWFAVNPAKKTACDLGKRGWTEHFPTITKAHPDLDLLPDVVREWVKNGEAVYLYGDCSMAAEEGWTTPDGVAVPMSGYFGQKGGGWARIDCVG